MHFRVLGFWRVAAAMLVMMYHFLFYGPESANWMAGRMVALMPLLDMFMMISGFLIMFRYIDHLLMEPGSYLRFLWRRVARFYPLYLVTLLYFVMVGIAVHLGFIGSTADGRYDFAALPANLLLIQGWGFTDTLTFNYVAWTLSAEWFCYLTLPVVVVTYRRFGAPGLVVLIGVTIAALEIAVAAGIIPFPTWMVADTWGAYRAFADFAIGAGGVTITSNMTGASIVRLLASDQIDDAAAVTLNANGGVVAGLDLNGFTETVGKLTVSSTTNGSATVSTACSWSRQSQP